MKLDWKPYFIFTPKEQKGIIVLGFILFFSLLINYLLPSDQMEKSNSKKEVLVPKKLFYFDPNRLDTATGYLLGFSKKQMATLLHYREKGGRFYKKEDLSKWYGITEAQVKLLLPWVRILDSIYKGRIYEKQSWAKHKFELQSQEKIDVNNVDAGDWIRITGLPAYKVKRILTYQKWSGGFTSILGLKKVYGITAFDFDMIKPFLKYQEFKTKKMNYQTMRFEDWMSLGIFDERTVWAILKQKKQQGRLSWAEMVIRYDLTEAEAMILKKRTNLSY
jgi:DNA uptake protein ComE-like DNA-binding protein